MNRLLKLLYPERRYFDGKPALQRRVEHICRSKKNNANSRAWRRVVFVGLPCFVLILSVGSYLQVVSVFPSGFQPWIMFAVLFGLCWSLALMDRPSYRRDLRYAFSRCGVPLCIECGYDLAKTDPRALCPECGAPYPQVGELKRMASHPSILAHGIDLVEVARIAKMLADHPERFRDRVFTPDEIAYCEASRKRAPEHFAARFAAKEAVLKALGTGWRDGIAWTDIEIRRDPAGVPSVRLAGEAASIAASRGIGTWLISLSHTSTLAQASVLGLGAVR